MFNSTTSFFASPLVSSSAHRKTKAIKQSYNSNYQAAIKRNDIYFTLKVWCNKHIKKFHIKQAFSPLKVGQVTKNKTEFRN